jgi:hypothetical protein
VSTVSVSVSVSVSSPPPSLGPQATIKLNKATGNHRMDILRICASYGHDATTPTNVDLPLETLTTS